MTSSFDMATPTSEADSVELLIEFIQNYEFIYNLQHKYHRDVLKVNNAWQELSTLTGMSVENCRKQWKSLRDRFTKEKRSLPSGSAIAESNWHLYDKMLFYSKYTKSRKTHTTTPVVQTEIVNSPSSSASSAWSTMDTLLSPGADGDNQDIEEPGEVHAPNIELRIEDIQQETPASRRGKRKRGDGTAATMENILNVAQNVAASMQAQSDQKSVNATFGQYVVARLDEMSPSIAKQKRKVMLEILESD